MPNNTPRGFIRKKTNSPCHNCTDRKIKCHSFCEKYKNYKNELMVDFCARSDFYKNERRVESYTINEVTKAKVK